MNCVLPLPHLATPIEFRVGTDALTVVVSSENDFVTALTKEQLGKIFTGSDSPNGMKLILPSPPKPFWSTAQAQTAAPSITSTKLLLLLSTSMLMARLMLPLAKKLCLVLEGAQFSEDDNVLVQGVEGSPVRHWLLRLCLLQ